MQVSPVTEITARPLIENSIIVTTSQEMQTNWSEWVWVNSLNPAINTSVGICQYTHCTCTVTVYMDMYMYAAKVLCLYMHK